MLICSCSSSDKKYDMVIPTPITTPLPTTIPPPLPAPISIYQPPPPPTPTPTPMPTPVIITLPPPDPGIWNEADIPNPSRRAFDSSPPGGGADINAYAVNPSRCNSIPSISISWQHNIDLMDFKSKNAFDFIAFRKNESLSYKFTVGTEDASGGFIYNDAANAAIRPSFITVTEQPCDFDVSKVVGGPNPNSCYVTGINGNSLNWANITGPLPSSYCRLIKGKTYYMNIRMQDARPSSIGGSPNLDSCTKGLACGGILQVL